MINQSPKISVIVPVYNVERYLPRCLDSILAQTFTDFELLLIDDGSKDNSGHICDEYAKVDNRIRVFHNENRGVSSARNTGLDNACGEWITFIDSDDYVEDNFLEKLFQSTNSDLKISGYTSFGCYNEEKIYCTTFISKNEIGMCLSKFLNDHIFRVPWAKLFRLNIINNNKLRFDTNLKICEDTIFVQQYLCFIDNLTFISIKSYNYFIQSTIRRYQLSKKDLYYSLQRIEYTYNMLIKKFLFTNIEYVDFIHNYLVGRLYFNFVGKQQFCYCQYKEFKQCISDNIKLLSYKITSVRSDGKIMYGLLKRKHFFIIYVYLNIHALINRLR